MSVIQSAISSIRKKADEILNDNQGWFRGGSFTPIKQVSEFKVGNNPTLGQAFQQVTSQGLNKAFNPYDRIASDQNNNMFLRGSADVVNQGLKSYVNSATLGLVTPQMGEQQTPYGTIGKVGGFAGGMGASPLGKVMKGSDRLLAKVAPKATGLLPKIGRGIGSEAIQTIGYAGASTLANKLGLNQQTDQFSPKNLATNLIAGTAFRGALSPQVASTIKNKFKMDFPTYKELEEAEDMLTNPKKFVVMDEINKYTAKERPQLIKNAIADIEKRAKDTINLISEKHLPQDVITATEGNYRARIKAIVQLNAENKLGNVNYLVDETKGMGTNQLVKTTIEPQVLPKAQPEIPRRPSGLELAQDNQSALTGNIPQGKVKIKTGPEKTPNQRAFLENVSRSDKTSEPLIQQTKLLEQTYEPITNKQSIAQARSIINKSADEAKNLVYSNAPTDNIKITTGIELAKRYEKQGNIDDSIDLINELDRQLREAGRGIQAASLWNKMSPETLVRTANRIAEKNKQALSKEVQGNILARMRRVSKMVDGAEKDNATLDVLNYIADNVKPGIGEIFDAYRYTNMLSNPKSHERNIYGNIFNTLVTRPLDIGLNATYDFIKNPVNPMVRDIHFSDVPRYYKNVFTSLGSALNASKEALKGSNLQFDATGAESAIEALRREKVPGVFKAIPKFMQAQDQFFSTLIAAGEKARLMKKGLSEEQAISQATKIADKYLLKERLGSSDAGYIVKALDSLGKLADSGRKLPVIGKAWGWFVPFIKTPVNFAKLSVEHSLLNLPGAKINTETLAKATAGSLFMAYAGKLAMEDRTTLSAPTDAKQKELFYASGKKPFSVRIGDTWVPMTYFGPFGAAMMIPAAMKQRFENDPGSYTDDVALKSARVVGDISKYLASQTPLKGIGDFVSLLDGDSDFTLQSILGGMSSQAIPLAGMNRWINGIIDDTYRKGSDLKSQILKSVPGGTLNMEAYTTPTGEESKRLPENRFLPYDIGRSDEKYAELEQQRLEKLQSNKEENLLKKQLKQGKAGGVSGDKIAYINENGTPTILDLSKYDKVAELPSSNKYQQAIKESKQYSEAAKILDNTSLSQEQQQTALTRLGIEPDKASYYQIANDNDNLKTMFVLDAINKVKTQGGGLSDIVSLLANQRTEINGKMIASNGVLDNLVDEGVLTKAQASQLKKYKFENGQLVTKSKGGTKAKKVSVTLRKMSAPRLSSSAPKVKRIKVPTFKKLKRTKLKVLKLQSVNK